MSVALRIDLGQPLPFRRTPEFLFGDTRRRARRLGRAAGGLLAVAVVATWWAAGTHTVRHDPVEPVRTFTGTAPPVTPRSIAPEEVFPLIPEPQASAVAREREYLPAPPVEAITPAGPAPGTAAPAMARPSREEPLRSFSLVEEEPSLAVSAVEPAPAPETPATAAVTGDTAPAVLAPTSGSAGSPSISERHYLQFGTYRLEESVTTVQRRYQMLGLGTIIQREGDYYVLRLLPFPTRADAEQEQARLQQMGIETLYIPPAAPQP